MRAQVAGHPHAPSCWSGLRAARLPLFIRRSMARHAFRHGRHAQALLISRAQDPVILALLGMFGEAGRRFEHGVPGTPAAALARIAALAHTGNAAAAVQLAQTVRPRARSDWRRRAASTLAGIDDRAALDLLDPDDPLPLRAALLARIGEAGAAESLLERIEAGRGPTSDLKLLQATLALDRGHPGRHEALVNAALRLHDLEPVRRPDPRAPLSVNNVGAARGSDAGGPLVSVVMAVRDVAPYLDAAIGSIVNQTWLSLELIVVDDGSVDDTVARVQDWSCADPRIRLHQRPAPGGPYVARNAGLALARGEFVTFHDGDDWSHPRRLERQVAPLIREPRLVATAAQWFRIGAAGRIDARKVWPLIRWHPASTMLRRETVLSRIGVFDPVLTGADCEFWARIREVFGKARTRSLRSPLTLGGARPDSLTTARGTGYGSDGSCPDRLAYWEAWHFWHARARAARVPLRILAGEPRPFEAPPALIVQPETPTPRRT